MKRPLSVFLIFVFVGLVGGTFYFLWSKSRKKPVEFPIETPQVGDVVKKTVATGAIVPREEVEIKPRVSGVLAELHVEPGKMVRRGDPIAKIQIIPNAQSLNRAEGEVRTRKIALDNAKRELDRNQALYDRGILPEADLSRFRNEWSLAVQAHAAATSDLQIVREGETRGASKQSNILVTSTVDGMVIDVPVKLGFSVIETNNFNPGTTIAIVADMNDMIFLGQVDESEVGKIKEGMELKIKIGALEDPVEGKLEYIAPKGKEIEGAIQFEIKAAIVRRPDQFIRAGYSANADIVLAERNGVLTIREAVVQFDKGKPFVEVETSPPQTFVRRDVRLGLSDGIHIEVLEGVAKDDRLKVPANAGPAEDGRNPLRRQGPPRRRGGS
jgi:HlyD family secretion protein